MPVPRFLGWREWISVAPAVGAEPFRSAIWSDEERLGRTDGFNLSGWRAECSSDLHATFHGGEDAVLPSAQKPRPARPPRHENPAKPGAVTPLPGIMGIAHGPEVSHERLVYGGAAKQRPPLAPPHLPPLHDVADAGVQGSHLPPGGGEPAQLSDIMLSFNEQTFSMCRGDVLSALAERDQQQAELAQQRRACLTEAGQEHRRRAARWRRRALEGGCRGRRESDASLSECQAADAHHHGHDREAARAARQQRAIQRIRAHEPGGRQEASEAAGGEAAPVENGEEAPPHHAARQHHAGTTAALRERVLQRLAKAKKRGRKKQSSLRTQRRERYTQLPVEEQQLCHEAFDCHRADVDTSLSECMLRCLCEMGLRGSTSSEKSAVEAVLLDVLEDLASEQQVEAAPNPGASPAPSQECASQRATDADGDGQGEPQEGAAPSPEGGRSENQVGSGSSQFSSLRLRVEEFATEIVPAVRGTLSLARTDEHFKVFMDATPNKDAVSITVEQLSVACGQLPVDMRHFREEVAAVVPTDSSSPRHKRKTLKSGQLQLDFETVHAALLRLEARAASDRRRRERQLLYELGLPQWLFWSVRDDLLRLHELFCQHSRGTKGRLGHEGVFQILCSVGLQHRGCDASLELKEFLADKPHHGHTSFEALLHLVHELRLQQRKLRQVMLRREFRKFDRDANGELDAGELVEGLLRSGFDKAALDGASKKAIMHEFDRELNGAALTFDQFQELCQRVVEQMVGSMNDKRLKLATAPALDESTLKELHSMFEQLDHDRTGSLSRFEANLACQSLVVDPAAMRQFDEHFPTVDTDKDGSITRDQYVDLVRLVVGDGIVKRLEGGAAHLR